ncbi:MAG: nucleotidyltransferase family protein [Flavobacteriaceae bacterium]|nr:nucleotidyltransferase family protein [Flavobacteriaceae bacterium]
MLTYEQQEMIINVLSPWKPVKIGVFGSFARGEQREDSDIDLLYDFSEPCGFAFSQVIDDLEERLQKKVDLINFNHINPYLKEDILKDLIIFYDKSQERRSRRDFLLSHSGSNR